MVTMTDGHDLIERILNRAKLSPKDRGRIRERLERVRGIGHAMPDDELIQRVEQLITRPNWHARVRTLYEEEVSAGGYEFLRALIASGLPPSLVPATTICALVLLRREDVLALAKSSRRRMHADACLAPVA